MDSAESELTASHCGIVRFMRGEKRFTFSLLFVSGLLFFLFSVSRFKDEHNSSGEVSEISKQMEQTRSLLDVRLPLFGEWQCRLRWRCTTPRAKDGKV